MKEVLEPMLGSIRQIERRPCPYYSSYHIEELDVTLNDGNITATSGAIPEGGPATLGDGGTVNITTPGAITVNSTIEVSSDDVETTPARRSCGNRDFSTTRFLILKTRFATLRAIPYC